MTATPAPTTMTARCPEDILAMAPVVIGFWPEESIVMLTFGARRPFHARLPLPPGAIDAEVRREIDDRLLEPARRHGARAVILLYYSDDPAAVAAIHAVLERGCRRRRIEVLTVLRTDGREYAAIDALTGEGPSTPYDVSGHPFVLEALLSGRLRHRTREDMVASLELVEDLAAPVLAALAHSGLLDSGPPTDGRSIRAEGEWVAATVARAVATGDLPPSDELGRLLWTLQVPRVRDAAWSLIDRAHAAAHVAFWTDVLRRTPDILAAAPAGLLGWAAWQAGDGALAWAALDRCRRGDPDYVLGRYLGTILDQAVPPDDWPGFDWSTGLPPGDGPRH